MCAFVMGGNGKVAIPPSVAPIVSSSITAGIFAIFTTIWTKGRWLDDVRENCRKVNLPIMRDSLSQKLQSFGGVSVSDKISSNPACSLSSTVRPRASTLLNQQVNFTQ